MFYFLIKTILIKIIRNFSHNNFSINHSLLLLICLIFLHSLKKTRESESQRVKEREMSPWELICDLNKQNPHWPIANLRILWKYDLLQIIYYFIFVANDFVYQKLKLLDTCTCGKKGEDSKTACYIMAPQGPIFSKKNIKPWKFNRYCSETW